MTGISTRNRVLRRVAFAVRISICRDVGANRAIAHFAQILVCQT